MAAVAHTGNGTSPSKGRLRPNSGGDHYTTPWYAQTDLHAPTDARGHTSGAAVIQNDHYSPMYHERFTAARCETALSRYRLTFCTPKFYHTQVDAIFWVKEKPS